jgi:hypothetical protein
MIILSFSCVFNGTERHLIGAYSRLKVRISHWACVLHRPPDPANLLLEQDARAWTRYTSALTNDPMIIACDTDTICATSLLELQCRVSTYPCHGCRFEASHLGKPTTALHSLLVPSASYHPRIRQRRHQWCGSIPKSISVYTITGIFKQHGGPRSIFAETFQSHRRWGRSCWSLIVACPTACQHRPCRARETQGDCINPRRCTSTLLNSSNLT